MLHYSKRSTLPIRQLSTLLHHLVECLKPKTPIPTGRPIPPDITRQVRQKVVLRTLQAAVLGHRIEGRAVLELEVVNVLDLGHLERVLDHLGEERAQRDPAEPCRVLPHLLREQRLYAELSPFWKIGRPPFLMQITF